MTKLFRSGALALACTLAAISVPASAQTNEERSSARAAGLAGLDAYNSGKYEQAADFFGRAESLMHAPTHLLYLARANVKLGHLVSAREYYLKLTQDRLPPTASKPFRDAQASGDKELDELEPRLPYVSVVVQGTGAKNVQVLRDGEPMPQALLGVPHPEDPGSHTFKASGDGIESAPSTIVLKDGVRETVVLTLTGNPSAGAPRGGASTTTTGSVGFGSDGAAASDSSSSGTSPTRIASYVTLGVGAVGLGVGTYFLVKSSSTRKKADDLNASCLAAMNCSDSVDELNRFDSDANSQRTIGAASMVVGGAALATGVVLLVVDLSKSHPAPPAASVRPVFGLGYAGLAGRF